MRNKDLNKYKSELLDVYKIRYTETSLINLFKKGLVSGTVHTCVGQEYTGVFISKYLNENDFIFSNHRGHGHYLSHTNDINGLISEILSKVDGASTGYGGSQHLINNNFLSNGIQGGLMSVASGHALAQAKSNSGNISVIFIGDGTLGEGAVYEAMNIMSLWNTPVLVVLEDNEIAQSNPSTNSISGSIKARPEAFGIKYLNSDVWDIKDLDEKCKTAVDFVKNKNKPVFLHLKCARINAHSKGDDNRSDLLVENLINIDLLNIAIKQQIISSDDLKKIENDIKIVIEKCLISKTLSEVNKHEIFLNNETNFSEGIKDDSKLTQAEKINTSLKEFLKKNKDRIIIGEDIEDFPDGTEKQYGGAFKITKGLSKEFQNQVKNTPISEYSITGLAIGYALKKIPIIVEIMFGDFATLIVDQLIQNASKFKTMYGKDIDLPFLLRTPMGGRRGYGPTHSQSVEKLFFGFQGLRVLALNPFSNPSKVIENVFEGEYRTPTILIENKILYTLSEPEIPSYYTRKVSEEKFRNNIISPINKDADLVIFCYGYSATVAIEVIYKLFIEYEILAEVFIPEMISPLNLSGIEDVVDNKKLLVCIEEGLEYGSVSSQLISILSEQKKLPPNTKIFSNNTIIPASKLAEDNLMTDADSIVEYISEKI